MSDILKQTIVNPDMNSMLHDVKNEIFATLNCVQIGKINKYDNINQTVDVQIQVKRRRGDNITILYPLLVDCPLIVMQGGGSFLEFPVKVGDFCLLLFNDRDIDSWWSTSNVVEPPSTRKHSLSDGFALVGINPNSSVLDLTGEKVKINALQHDVEIETGKTVTITSVGECNINSSSVNLSGDNTLTDFVLKGTSFMQELLIAFNAHTHNFSGTGSVQTPTNVWTKESNFPNSVSTYVKTK